jgi:hypothetical protein
MSPLFYIKLQKCISVFHKNVLSHTWGVYCGNHFPFYLIVLNFNYSCTGQNDPIEIQNPLPHLNLRLIASCPLYLLHSTDVQNCQFYNLSLQKPAPRVILTRNTILAFLRRRELWLAIRIFVGRTAMKRSAGNQHRLLWDFWAQFPKLTGT